MRIRLALVACVLALVAPASAHAGAEQIELVASEQISPRLEELTLRTPAVEEPTGVRVLLPDGYAAIPDGRYPVLYLLHGALDDYRSWTDKGTAAELTAGLPLIVVMPDSGSTHGYTDWYNGGAYGAPAWETYHVRQLIPWIDQRYRTVAKRRGRALTGLSMGGGGTMTYASRFPAKFVHAAGFSPAVDVTHPSLQLVNQTSFGPDGPESPAHGSYRTQEVRWRGVNPTDLAENLRGIKLSLRTGDGSPGGEHGGDTYDVVERSVYEMSVTLHQRLTDLGIDHVWDYYGSGDHSWPYWQRDLKLELPEIMASFADPPPRPSRFAYRSIDPAYGAYGWEVRVDRPALEFSRIAVRGRRGFSLSGSGTATVRSAKLFEPGAEYGVAIDGPAQDSTATVTADPDGRITVPLDLGPGNPHQQYTEEADAAGGTAVRTATVAVSPA